MKFKFTSPCGYIPAPAVSQVIVSGKHAYLSGQISYDPATGEYPHDSMAAQTSRILENMQGVLEDLGLSMKDVVKCNVFISSMEYFAEMDEVYRRFFGEQTPPARQTVTAGLWDNLDIEISAEVISDQDILPKNPDYIVNSTS